MGVFGSLIKSVVDVATLPLDVVKDVVSFGEEEATIDKIDEIGEDLDNIIDDIF